MRRDDQTCDVNYEGFGLIVGSTVTGMNYELASNEAETKWLIRLRNDLLRFHAVHAYLPVDPVFTTLQFVEAAIYRNEHVGQHLPQSPVPVPGLRVRPPHVPRPQATPQARPQATSPQE